MPRVARERERFVAPRVPVDRVVARAGAGTGSSRRPRRFGHASTRTPAARRPRSPWPSGSRACPTVSARSRRRARPRAAPCSPRGARGRAPAARRASARRRAAACTTATTRSPQRSSGTPTTTASNTSAWPFSTDSTSSGYTFSPPVLIDTEPRPSSVIEPVGVDDRVVAGHRPAHAVDDRERRRGLLRVLVVAERDGPRRASRPTTPARRGPQIVAEHQRVVGDAEPRRARDRRRPTTTTDWPWPPVSDAP